MSCDQSRSQPGALEEEASPCGERVSYLSPPLSGRRRWSHGVVAWNMPPARVQYRRSPCSGPAPRARAGGAGMQMKCRLITVPRSSRAQLPSGRVPSRPGRSSASWPGCHLGADRRRQRSPWEAAGGRDAVPAGGRCRRRWSGMMPCRRRQRPPLSQCSFVRPPPVTSLTRQYADRSAGTSRPRCAAGDSSGSPRSKPILSISAS